MPIDGMEMNFDLREPMASQPPALPGDRDVTRPGGPLPPPPPGGGALPPGFGQNPQSVMQQIMQMILGENLRKFFGGGLRPPSGFFPGTAPPAFPGFLPPDFGGGQPMSPGFPQPPVQGPLTRPPGADPNLAFASGGPQSPVAGGSMGLMGPGAMSPGGTMGGPNPMVMGWPSPMAAAQGPMGMMQGPMGFGSPYGGNMLNDILRLFMQQQGMGMTNA